MQLYKPVLLTVIALLAIAACKTSKRLHEKDSAFTPIFDGKTLNGWEGDPKYWRAENGEIIGEITPATIIRVNTFLIYTKALPGDFILKAEYRISKKGNSGINYRSTRVDSLPYALKGYQADLDGKDKYNLGYPKYSGQNYEERGRQFLAPRGQRTVIETGKPPRMVDSLGTKAELLSHIHYDDWNELMIVVKGNNMKHYINGILMSEVTDNDVVHRKMNGLIGVQVHVGPPMKIEYRNMMIKKL